MLSKGGVAGRPLFAWGTTRQQPLEVWSRVVVAAGCGGDGRAFEAAGLAAHLGALTTPSYTSNPLHPGSGTGPVECVGGLLYPALPANPSLRRALELLDRVWARLPIPVIVSLLPLDAADLQRQLALLDESSGSAAVELNLELAHTLAAGATWQALLRSVLPPIGSSRLPVLVKLPALDETPLLAEAAMAAGADAVVVSDGRRGAAIAGVEEGESGHLLAGPAQFPQAFALLQGVMATGVRPVVACGGIATVEAAEACLRLGACAVQIGSALLRNPTSASLIAVGVWGHEATATAAPFLDPPGRPR